VKRLVTTFLVSAGLLAGCAPVERTPAAGAGALGDRLSTMDEVVRWIRGTAGECADVTSRGPADLTGFFGHDIAARYAPFVTEWITCAVSPEFPKVGVLLFSGDSQRKFQESWRAAMANGEVADGPSLAFGNGFAVSSGSLGTSELGLYYFRCDYHDPRVRQVPSDVSGCVFAHPEHGHH
jgi:hypothetical protein